MLKPRIIPCLLVKDKGLVKTVNFANPKYVGDPINAVKIFNEKEVDELIVLDIDASVQNREPDFSMIKSLAVECRMPFCYGGGIKTVEQAKKIINLGVEKVALSSVVLENPELIMEISQAIGSQSVAIVLDVKKEKDGDYKIWVHNGKKATGRELIDFCKEIENFGVGEFVINSIDNDGVMKGYDLDLVDNMRNCVETPITILGGAGKLEDIRELIERYGIIGCGAGSLFVFKGKYRAVLINYPSSKEREELVST